MARGLGDAHPAMRKALVPVLFVLAAGSCKPAVVAPPPPPPPKLGPIEMPEDLVAEILVRDPHALLETTAHATGSKDVDPANFAKMDGDIAAFLEIVDLHGPAGAMMIGDVKNPDSWHFGVALKLKDPKGARQLLAEKVKSGKIKAEDSPAIRSKIYPAGKTTFALINEAIVLSDNRATLESAGRWIAKEGTEGTPPHDVIVRVPVSRYSVMLKNELKKLWEDEANKSPDTAAAGQPFMNDLLNIVAGIGDVDLSLDLEKEEAVVDLKIGASGLFSQWLAKYPAGPARSILTLPKSNSAFVLRFPDSVSDIFKSVADDAAKKSAQPSKELEDLRTFLRAVGHEIAFATLEKKQTQKTTEAMVRIELTDPVAAKKALAALIADAAAKPDRKLQRQPYSRFGADGEAIQYTSGSEKYDARWAIKGNLLYVDVAWEGKPTLLDAAVDPSGKTLLSANPRAKVFADRLPKDGLVAAYYAETPKAPKLEELGAVPSLMGVRWGWIGAAKEGVSSQWNVPLADLGEFLHKKEPPPPATPPMSSAAPAASSAAPPPPPPPPKKP
jgi:hypothetical protein